MLWKRALAVSLAPLTLLLSANVAADPEMAPEEILDKLVEETGSAYLSQSPQNRQMMPDNPAYWVAEEGEELFMTPRGPNNVSLEGCDFGKGPGVLEGAYVELPRYFDGHQKVMDLETRLVHCMTTLQGFSKDDAPVKKRHGSGSDMMKLQTYIAMQSNGMAWNPRWTTRWRRPCVTPAR
jgi:sulfur-oxidizing protein SoxA